MSQERTQLINAIVRQMPIVDRDALSRMTMEELENIRRGYRIGERPESPPWRSSDLQRTWCPLTCAECDRRWSMELYGSVSTTVWCPHCGVECIAGIEVEAPTGGEGNPA